MKKLMMMFAAVAAILMTGCGTPAKMRDVDVKGMYLNGYTEVLAIGRGTLTSIPSDKEALAAHYEEDTAWLSPHTKTHTLDLFLVGTNSVANSAKIVDTICKTFGEVAPTVSSNNAEVAKGGGTVFSYFGQNHELNAKTEALKIAADAAVATNAVANAAASCTNGTCTATGCTGGICTDPDMK